jgi:hypothetical protein
VLHAGGVAAYPTDSVYALGCAIEARDAIERIYKAKGMKPTQRLALICPTSRRRRVRPALADRVPPRPADLPRAVHAGRARDARGAARPDRSQAPHRRHPHHQPPGRAGAGRRPRPAAADDQRDHPRTAKPCRDADEILEAFAASSTS